MNRVRLKFRHLPKNKPLIVFGLLATALCMVAVYTFPPLRHNTRSLITTATAHATPTPKQPFPELETATLTPQQIKIINLARAEYAKHPLSYDANVLKYSQGHKEAWCANFVSWIMQTGGQPYSNPNSGSWRIPGVYTLQEYYKSQNKYQAAGEYTPQPGDVAFYVGRHTLDLFSTSHVALVVKADSKTMTTLGGNENGKLRLTTQTIALGKNSLVGFGKLGATTTNRQ